MLEMQLATHWPEGPWSSGVELAGTREFADLLAASAGGASRGMPEDLPTSQMSDPKGSELAGTQGFEPR